ncbi:hypothetical protein [Sinimarinibacterium flocculans]|uniref:hypothetical protein n=1 Tax=Sinimarinibacterium flocculans TaxID=985250 RepID=UPI003513E1AD
MFEADVKSTFSWIDIASNVLSLAFKLGALIGGICLLSYCYRLNYFPVGVTVGDGLLLIILAVSFGIVYGFFVVGLVSLGVCMTPILRPLQHLVFAIWKRFSKRCPERRIEFVKPDLNALLFGAFGVLAIVAIARSEPDALWTLPATSVLLAVVFAGYVDFSAKLADLQKAEKAAIQQPAASRTVMLDKSRLKLGRMLSGILLVVIPLIAGKVTGELLENGMRLSGVRKADSYVLLREPYSAFVPGQYLAQGLPEVAGLTAFEGVHVMFAGIGTRSVIEFADKDRTKRLEVPNESIIVIPR